MSLAEQMYATLGQYAGVNALVGTRIYPDQAPQSVARPYVVWQQISGVPLNDLAGYQGRVRYRVQVTCWAKGATDARDIEAQVRLAMAAATGFKSLHVDNRALPQDLETKLFGAQSDFSVSIVE